MIAGQVKDQADIAIIGGGAAGLTAAIVAAEAAPDKRVIILDGARSLGAKILVAGGGRCNVTHDVVAPEDFNGTRHFVRNVLAAFNVQAAVKWFASLGVELKTEDTGKLFPVTDSAKTVLNALLKRCDQLAVERRCGLRVTSATSGSGGGFLVQSDAAAVECDRLILAAGGRSLPRSGSDGSGWALAKSLAHSVTPTYAALVPLVLDAAMFHASVAGVSMEVELSTIVGGKRIDQRSGSMLWTHFGISGPVVMDASRHWVIANETGLEPTMLCNCLWPDGFETVERWLIALTSSRPKLGIGTAIATRIPARVADALLRYGKIDPLSVCGQLPREERRRLVHLLTALPLQVRQHRGWNYAEVTAGGVPLAEINYRTMESRLCPGLYLAGEMLDCDGRIGGFNFQWAWATGFLAGSSSGRSLASESRGSCKT